MASGAEALWKIECDSLTDADWDTVASWISPKYKFHEVFGVPNGGLKLAERLASHCEPGHRQSLIVEDVYTTGQSMRNLREILIKRDPGRFYVGVVLFARNPIVNADLNWVKPIFQFW